MRQITTFGPRLQSTVSESVSAGALAASFFLNHSRSSKAGRPLIHSCHSAASVARKFLLRLLVTVPGVAAVAAVPQSVPAQSALLPETQRLDVEKARVSELTVPSHGSVSAPNGLAANRVSIYLGDGAIRQRSGNSPATTIAFHRGEVGWMPAGIRHFLENTTERPIRILQSI